MSDGEAAPVPTAGLTARRSLDLTGSQLAKRVLVTGATGGVGRYAVQLANLSGANVTAFVRDLPESSEQLRSSGADTVVDAPAGRFELVVDAVGGTTFAAAIEHISPRGGVVNVATDRADEMVAFKPRAMTRHPGRRSTRSTSSTSCGT